MHKDKIVFLDIDGVLNSEASCDDAIEKGKSEVWRYMPHPMHLQHLDRILKETGAKVVISSTWRIGCSSRLMWRSFFAALGFDDIHVIGTTERFHQKRGIEIQKWIDDRNEESKQDYAPQWDIYPVDKFVILDDDSDMEHLMPYLIQTKSTIGLTAEIADKVIEFLGAKNKNNIEVNDA